MALSHNEIFPSFFTICRLSSLYICDFIPLPSLYICDLSSPVLIHLRFHIFYPSLRPSTLYFIYLSVLIHLRFHIFYPSLRPSTLYFIYLSVLIHLRFHIFILPFVYWYRLLVSSTGIVYWYLRLYTFAISYFYPSLRPSTLYIHLRFYVLLHFIFLSLSLSFLLHFSYTHLHYMSFFYIWSFILRFYIFFCYFFYYIK